MAVAYNIFHIFLEFSFSFGINFMRKRQLFWTLAPITILLKKFTPILIIFLQLTSNFTTIEEFLSLLKKHGIPKIS